MSRLLVLVLALPLAAQESHFGVRSRLVLVPVTITDQKGPGEFRIRARPGYWPAEEAEEASQPLMPRCVVRW